MIPFTHSLLPSFASLLQLRSINEMTVPITLTPSSLLTALIPTIAPSPPFPVINFWVNPALSIEPDKLSTIWFNYWSNSQSPTLFTSISRGEPLSFTNAVIPPATLWVTWLNATNFTYATTPPLTTTISTTTTTTSKPSEMATTSLISGTNSIQGNPTGAVTSGPTISAISPTISPDSTSSPNSKPKSKEISGGAVAGVAIGCLIAGALIAGLVAWLCLKRRRSAARTRYSETSTVALMHHEKGPVAQTAPLSGGIPTTAAVDSSLPQPLEDKAISAEISKISNLMKNHVQSYYHGRTVNPRMLDSDDLKALGDNIPISLGSLSSLLNSPKTREIALRFCIASVVTARMQLNEPPSTTFLPPEISKCLQSMRDVDRHSRGKYIRT